MKKIAEAFEYLDKKWKEWKQCAFINGRVGIDFLP